jgi:hypothetical protein
VNYDIAQLEKELQTKVQGTVAIKVKTESAKKKSSCEKGRRDDLAQDVRLKPRRMFTPLNRRVRW